MIFSIITEYYLLFAMLFMQLWGKSPIGPVDHHIFFPKKLTRTSNTPSAVLIHPAESDPEIGMAGLKKSPKCGQINGRDR